MLRMKPVRSRFVPRSCHISLHQTQFFKSTRMAVARGSDFCAGLPDEVVLAHHQVYWGGQDTQTSCGKTGSKANLWQSNALSLLTNLKKLSVSSIKPGNDHDRLSPILGTLPYGRAGPSLPVYNFRHFYMKSISESVGFTRHLSMGCMGVSLLLVLGTLALATGCGKKDNSSPAPAPTNAAATTAAPEQTASPETTPSSATTTASAPSAPGFVPLKPSVSTDPNTGLSFLQQLNRAVLSYRMQNHHNPATVDELATFAGVQLPPPPAGKKYAFNNRGWVVLVDN